MSEETATATETLTLTPPEPLPTVTPEKAAGLVPLSGEQKSKLEERVDRLKREDTGLRFTITCLLAFCLFQAGLLIWIATR